jgi:tetraacyldisaccharide 4'-kinase
MTAGPGGIAAAWYRGAWWLWLLRPLELVFRIVAAARRRCYRHGFCSTYRADKPVVVVGNITVGGTGKTPIVIALVEALQGAGLRPGVVSRGYGATPGDFPRRVSAASSAGDCGDEPLLIFRRTGCPCVISPDRPAAVRELLAQADVDIVISDDGLQHYALERDMEIVVMDRDAGLGNGFCLPAGPLREPRSRLAEVDQVLYRGSEDPADGVSYRIEGLVKLVNGERRGLDPADFPDGVVALAGIGRPQQFFNTLQDLGLQLETRVFPDHHAYRAADFADLQSRPLIMTEKDAVKCQALVGDNAWYLRISAVLPDSLVSRVVTLARP